MRSSLVEGGGEKRNSALSLFLSYLGPKGKRPGEGRGEGRGNRFAASSPHGRESGTKKQKIGKERKYVRLPALFFLEKKGGEEGFPLPHGKRGGNRAHGTPSSPFSQARYQEKKGGLVFFQGEEAKGKKKRKKAPYCSTFPPHSSGKRRKKKENPSRFRHEGIPPNKKGEEQAWLQKRGEAVAFLTAFYIAWRKEKESLSGDKSGEGKARRRERKKKRIPSSVLKEKGEGRRNPRSSGHSQRKGRGESALHYVIWKKRKKTRGGAVAGFQREGKENQEVS